MKRKNKYDFKDVKKLTNHWTKEDFINFIFWENNKRMLNLIREDLQERFEGDILTKDYIDSHISLMEFFSPIKTMHGILKHFEECPENERWHYVSPRLLELYEKEINLHM